MSTSNYQNSKLIRDINKLISEAQVYDTKHDVVTTAGRLLGNAAGLGASVALGLPYGVFNWPGMLLTAGGGIAGGVLSDKLFKKRKKIDPRIGYADQVSNAI
jgi:hypothetical protein